MTAATQVAGVGVGVVVVSFVTAAAVSFLSGVLVALCFDLLLDGGPLCCAVESAVGPDAHL